MSASGVCSKCITGFVHDGKPKGTKGTIAGLPTYIAKTSSPKEGIIVIVPDAFGWEFINNQLLADEYADRTGFTVYLPDFMNGITAKKNYCVSQLFFVQRLISR
jgi:dienelactone hydrolase